MFYVEDDRGTQSVLCKQTNNPQFIVCSITDYANYTNATKTALIKQMGIGLIVMIVSMLFMGILITYFLKPLGVIQQYLLDFFSFANHESKLAPKPIDVKSNDEFGIMAKEIALNIEATKKGLEQDAKTIHQSTQTVKAIEDGQLTARISNKPHNPQLKEFIVVLNNMLDVLQERVGADMNVIHDVLESYKALDFTTEVANAKGNVETMTNILGKEIRKMLETSSHLSQRLVSHSDELKDQCTNLLKVLALKKVHLGICECD